MAVDHRDTCSLSDMVREVRYDALNGLGRVDLEYTLARADALESRVAELERLLAAAVAEARKQEAAKRRAQRQAWI